MADLTTLRIVFMGTPDFAVASLRKLVEAGLQVVAVVTAPDKAAGRGLQLKESPVKQYAKMKGIPVLQPEKLRDPGFLETLQSYKADLQVVVAFRMLPEIVWNMPPMGTINVHGSLLPQYRGAAPINWAIINGETETGVTTFQLQHAIDTGEILLQKKIPIAGDETAGELHDEMMMTGADLLLETLEALVNGNITPISQESINEKEIKHAPKIFTDTCRIDWSKSVTETYNLIRGLSPYPAAFTMLDGKQLKIFRATYALKKHELEPGTLLTDRKNFLDFVCRDGIIQVQTLQLEGKKKMEVTDFLRGYRFQSEVEH